MEIIPVIDLKQGDVVHARMGQRERYRPVNSTLCEGSNPVAVVGGFLSLHPFSAVYVADLDAIGGGAGNLASLEALRTAFPAPRLWVDSGHVTAVQARDWLARGFGAVVLGTESLAAASVLAETIETSAAADLVLSLDFRDDVFVGPPELLEQPDLWPATVIVMTLGRVGSGLGPDLRRLDDIRARAGGRRVFAAGGVRNAADLHELAGHGIAGALVATALHDGRLGPAEIATIYGLKHL